jgi:hypothetical protein
MWFFDSIERAETERQIARTDKKTMDDARSGILSVMEFGTEYELSGASVLTLMDHFVEEGYISKTENGKYIKIKDKDKAVIY